MIRFAGVDLCLGDPEGAVQAWIDRYRSMQDLVPVADPATYHDGRDRPQGHWPHAVGLPRLNWQLRPPRWRLNSLWWPTGASRFAVGLFLATLDRAELIQQALSASGSGTLVISDGTRSVSLTMYALPMRPIGAIGSDNPVVLLPLVDARYFWQWSKIDDIPLGPTSTWSDVRTKIVAGLGVTVAAEAPDADYRAPDWSEWVRQAENAALALDGYAASVGQRFVAKLDGTYALQSWETAEPLASANIDLTRVAGGAMLAAPGVAPGQVTVAFPRRQGGIVQANGAVELVTRSAGDFGFTTAVPGRAVIHTTFQADFSSRSSGADNAAALSSLAGAIAADFYGWRKRQHSVTVAHLASDWTINGYDDYWWALHGTQVDVKTYDDEDPEGFTRDAYEEPELYLSHTLIESLPANVGVNEQLAQDPATGAPRTFRPMQVFRAQLTSGWTEGEGSLPDSATARLLYDASGTGSLATDGHDVKLFDTMGIRGDEIESGDKVWVAALAADTSMFELISATGSSTPPPVRFRLTAAIQTGGSAAAVIRTFNGTTYVDADAIVVFDWWSIAGGGRGMWQAPSSAEGWAIRREVNADPEGNPEYDIVWMEQTAKAVEFTLTEYMGQSSTGQASATVTASWDQGISPGETITVHDDQSRWPDAIAGCKGTAWRSEYADPSNPATPYYKIISCTRAVREATATLNADMCGSTPSVTGWTPVPIGEHQVDPGAGTLANPRGHYGQSGDVVLFLRTSNAPPFTWAVVDVELHTVDLTIDRRYHEASCQIQVLKRQIAVELCADAPDPENDENWDTELQLSEITYVTGTTQSLSGSSESPTCTVEHTRAKLCGFAVSDPASNSTALTLTRIDPVTDLTLDTSELLAEYTRTFAICVGTTYEVQVATVTDCPEEEE